MRETIHEFECILTTLNSNLLNWPGRPRGIWAILCGCFDLNTAGEISCEHYEWPKYRNINASKFALNLLTKNGFYNI